MKLDLLNSRQIPIQRDYRVYDSLEGKYIDKPSLNTYNLSNISFNSTQPKIDFSKKGFAAPNIFDRAKVDNRGFYIEVANTVCKPNKSVNENLDASTSAVPLSSKLNTNSTFTSNVSVWTGDASDANSPSKLYTPSLDQIKDKIYHPNEDTIISRVNGGKLPGGNWSEVSRDIPIKSVYTGNDDLDKFGHERGRHGIHPHAVKFSTMPRDDIMVPKYKSAVSAKKVDKDSLPLRQRIRLERVEAYLQEKEQRVTRRKLKVNKTTSGVLLTDSLSSTVGGNLEGLGSRSINGTSGSVGTGTIKFSEADRFNNPHYKQERYVKTSGMLLDNNWDKKLDKKIVLGFSQQASSSNLTAVSSVKSLGGDVDVDVGHLFSTSHAVRNSPVRYSAAFRSAAKVGMEIRPTTSPDHLGPGSFRFPEAVSIRNPDKNSMFFLRDRKMDVRQAGPELTERIKPFHEQHTSGPVFNKTGEVAGTRNAHMENLVRDKMTQIYPRLANKKFPPKQLVSRKQTTKIK